MTILPCDKTLYKKKLTTKKIIAVFAVAITLLVNILLVALRTESTHTAFLIVNILTDAICGCFLIAFIYFKILPDGKLYSLATFFQTAKQSLCGVVTKISQETITVSKLDCRTVTLVCEKGKRVVYEASIGNIKLEQGKKYEICAADNIVVSAEERL